MNKLSICCFDVKTNKRKARRDTFRHVCAEIIVSAVQNQVIILPIKGGLDKREEGEYQVKIEVWEVEKNRKYQGVRYSGNFRYQP